MARGDDNIFGTLGVDTLDGGWGDDTEEALRRAPVDGFPVGAVCRYGDNDE